jgi:D-lyxose ketol-isomerase
VFLLRKQQAQKGDRAMNVSRRKLMAVTAGTVVAAAGVAGCTAGGTGGGGGPVKTYKNADFYGTDGKFKEDFAKQAYFDMMQRFGYPVYEKLRKEMWVADFGLGKYAEVGMAGIFWINDKEGKYLGHEIYLLPGQMIPEHWHVKIDEAAAKAEAWQLRYGAVTLFGEGDPSPEWDKVVWAGEKECTTVKHATVLALGDVAPLNRIEARHFMVGGPEGCIVSEYASYHDGNALRFTNPKVKL